MQNYFIKLPASLNIFFFKSRGLCFYILKLSIKKYQHDISCIETYLYDLPNDGCVDFSFSTSYSSCILWKCPHTALTCSQLKGEWKRSVDLNGKQMTSLLITDFKFNIV